MSIYNLYQTTLYILLGFALFTLLSFIRKKRIYTLDIVYRPLLIISVIGFITSILNTNYSIFNESISDTLGLTIFVIGIITSVVASTNQIRGK